MLADFSTACLWAFLCMGIMFDSGDTQRNVIFSSEFPKTTYLDVKMRHSSTSSDENVDEKLSGYSICRFREQSALVDMESDVLYECCEGRAGNTTTRMVEKAF
jgi:hypothetical protein